RVDLEPVEEQRDEDTGRARAEHVHDHRQTNDHAQLDIGKTDGGNQAYEDGEDTAVNEPHKDFAADQPEQASTLQFPQGQRPHGDGHGLRAGIATHRGDDRHQDGKGDHLLDGGIEEPDHHRSQDRSTEVDQQPGGTAADGAPDIVRQFLLSHASHELHVFAGLFVDDIHHVIHGKHTHQAVVVGDRDFDKVIALEDPCRFLLVLAGIDGNEVAVHQVFDAHVALRPQELVEGDGAEHSV